MSENVKFTASRISAYQCPTGKEQSILWDSSAPGLGLRATAKGAKSFIFQTKLNGETMRITIGSSAVWEISAAQAEARRLMVMVDKGQDPRQVKAKALEDAQAASAAKESEQKAMIAKQARESITLGTVWLIYVEERKAKWSKHHIRAHEKAIQAGGGSRYRSKKEIKAGPLAEMANLPLVELTPAKVESWASNEVAERPTYAALSLRLLKAFLNWCAEHPEYKQIVYGNAAKSKKARESMGKAKVKNDVLQREQVAPWFSAVNNLSNPVISAYLQCLLITGARREELGSLKWTDVNFQWGSMTINDKIEDMRVIPLTPYVAQLLVSLPRRNEWVFSSMTAASGRLAEPRFAHNKALDDAGLPPLSLHGLRRSFASLCEWVEMPSGIAAQIQGHAPQGVREQNYIRRSLDLLRKWHIKIEAWILNEAGIKFTPMQQEPKFEAP